MGSCRRSILLHLLPPLFTPLFFLIFHCSSAVNTTITPTQYITDTQTVVSSAKNFKLGFFKPGNSTSRYVGIWCNNIPGPTTVWVANRDTPLKDSSGVFKIADDGNLVVLDGRENVLWTTNVSNIALNTSSAELSDSGNLVLRETNSNGRILWQSSDHPSNTFMPGMKIGVNLRTGEKQVLTSWKDTDSDPSTGNFTLEIDPIDIPQAIIKNGFDNRRHWRSGPWNNRIFIGIPTMYNVYLNGFSLLREEGTVYLNLAYADNSSLERFVLHSDGKLVQTNWDEENKQWIDSWYSRISECDIYNKCGSFGSCDAFDSPICSCLRGFEPKFKDEWSKGNWSGGCERRTELLCERINRTSERNNETSTNGGEKESDGFLKLEKMKVPDHVNWWPAEVVEECGQKCLNNCSCIAYSFDSNIGCMWWTGDLIDIQKFSNFSGAGVDLYIRVAYSDLDKKKDAKKIIIIMVVIGIVTVIFCTYFCWRRITKQRGRKKKGMRISLFDMDDRYGETSDPNMLGDNPELKIFNFETLAIATDNFSLANKLGQGGFGSVYKGKLLDGQEIAAKRLSRSSGQGLEEFKNEVLVISKLQHRNLVRLLGCYIEGEEKILIYEYMPNKSLDAFLFDPIKRALLDWRKRIQIIEGISRGILYLHRDSRLRVIHRDLKASNILLDEELNPKISDFGMARIFGGDELQANTRRVVGTYGYMSPEYAMEGLFSEKSDVFSFGVLLLEIVSGKRSTSFYHPELSLSLLGYAWQLWNENMMQLLIDPTLLSEPFFEEEILRCIDVGLLCVQEFAKDRPTMSTTLSMLTSEITTLPTPKQPAFTQRPLSSDSSSSRKDQKADSVNNVTITCVEGR